MKKLLTAGVIVLVCMAACNSNSTTEATSSDSITQSRDKEISDSTKMLDKKLADSSSKYSPDSLKK